jgi:hypothetical protein
MFVCVMQTVVVGNVKNSVSWINERSMQVFTKQL